MTYFSYSQDKGKVYYVATWGDDSNPGTKTQPWATFQKASNSVIAGDTVYFRGGVWYPTSGITIHPKLGTGQNGSPGKYICYFNYPGETPIFDFKNAVALPANPFGDGNRYLTGLSMWDAHWLHFKGLTIRNVYQREENVRAMGISGFPQSNMVFENITVHNIGGEGWYCENDVGYYEGENYGWDGSGYVPYDTTRYINCDTYQCCDTLPANIGNDPGNMGDGFKVINGGAYVTFDNCRAWYCSDDGFDMPGFGVTNFSNCWSFANGLTNGLPDPEYEGNGFKIGGNSGPSDRPKRTLTNCLAAYNKASGIFVLEYKGYNKTKARIYNCTVYKNGYGITISHNPDFTDSENIIRNTIVYGSVNIDAAGRPYELDVQSLYGESNNTFKYANLGSISKWTNSTNVSVSDDDFITLDSTGLSGPRRADGSLPDIPFLKLVPESDLVNAGVDVGLPFYGSAPDIGAFECDYEEGSFNRYPTISISSPVPESMFMLSTPINIHTIAHDRDGQITKVDFYSGKTKIGEATASPWSFSWDNVPLGPHSLRAVATDNQRARTTSSSITINIKSDDVILFPNPNNGIFFLALTAPLAMRRRIIISSYTGKTIYQGSMSEGEIIKEIDLTGSGILPSIYVLVMSDTKIVLTKTFLMH